MNTSLFLAQSETGGVFMVALGIVLLIVIGLVILFPLLWFAISFLISSLGDWKKLAAKYAAGDRVPVGAMQTDIMGWVGTARYKHTLIVHFAADGLYLEAHKFFRVGHPTLFIPWAEVSARDTRKVMQWKLGVLRVGSPRVGSIGLPLDLLKSYDPHSEAYYA